MHPFADIRVAFFTGFAESSMVAFLHLRFDGLAVRDLLFGWLLSGLMAGVFYLILLLTGQLEFAGFAWQKSAFLLPLLSWFALHLIVGWWEELFFRGYLFNNMVAGMGFIAAIIVSCLLYGAMHAGNPNATIVSTAVIAAFGFLRLYGLLATRQLWLSMGMHAGWNFFQGPVFGFAASGHNTFRLIEHNTSGASWITGGPFGPEGSVIMVPILAAAIYLMHLWAKKIQPDRIGS